jgi:hypothetical protein
LCSTIVDSSVLRKSFEVMPKLVTNFLADIITSFGLMHALLAQLSLKNGNGRIFY